VVGLFPMTQEQALNVLKTGANVFLTGEPGSGKTFVINSYISWLNQAGIPVAVTASTGIAATHIGGMTIHSWSGIGVRDNLTAYDLEQIGSKEATVKRLKKAKVLVIDEISMLDGKILDGVDRICRSVRQSSEPFGGLQVVFVGDFFQLPPITKNGDAMRYAFESYAWLEAKTLTCYLSEQHRQEDELFLSLLKSIRTNDIEEEHYTLLQEQKEIGYENIEPTRLYTHNADVDAVNAEKLKSLSGQTKKFFMSGNGSKVLVESLMRNCLSPELLELKEEAMVMCTKNNFEAGYVNGTMGRVVRFDFNDGYPVIKTPQGREIKIEPVRWEVIEDGKPRAGISQVPLRLAWAITIHKSQGMSLDAAEIDLSKAFVYGQGYVALSRVRSLLGLKLLGMHPNALQVDPKVIRQDKKFRDESEMLDDNFVAMSQEELSNLQNQFVTAVGGKMPTGEVTAEDLSERMRKESTLEETKFLLSQGKSVSVIAKERGMAQSTIWTHIEKLGENKELDEAMLANITINIANWDLIYAKIAKVIDEVGHEKLKPIFEATNEEFDYDLIRLARIVYKL
jgi:ATP-dependent DNA helicase PIF1